MLAQVMKIVSPGPPSLLFDTILIATGIALQFAFAYYLEWLSKLGAPAPRAGQPARARRPALAGGRPGHGAGAHQSRPASCGRSKPRGRAGLLRPDDAARRCR